MFLPSRQIPMARHIRFAVFAFLFVVLSDMWRRQAPSGSNLSSFPPSLWDSNLRGEGLWWRTVRRRTDQHQRERRCLKLPWESERDRERESSARKRTGGGARSRGLEGSSVRWRAGLGHSILNRSMHQTSYYRPPIRTIVRRWSPRPGCDSLLSQTASWIAMQSALEQESHHCYRDADDASNHVPSSTPRRRLTVASERRGASVIAATETPPTLSITPRRHRLDAIPDEHHRRRSSSFELISWKPRIRLRLSLSRRASLSAAELSKPFRNCAPRIETVPAILRLILRPLSCLSETAESSYRIGFSLIDLVVIS